MPTVWAIADLHLSFGVPNKKMDIFGPKWVGHAEKIRMNWEALVQKEDLVLLPGDISWAMKLEETALDFAWIAALPGTKVMIRGNHDLWWSSVSKVRKVLPPSIHAIHNDVFHWNEISVGGARLWDSPEFNFASLGPGDIPLLKADEKIFSREMARLEMSLKQLDQKAKYRLAMTHYPPVGLDIAPTQASALLEKYNVDYCCFGHLHNVKGDLFGGKYLLTACDYLDFKPRSVVAY
ncbi:MAG: metallophosphoesterase [Chlamydiales bacterium]